MLYVALAGLATVLAVAYRLESQGLAAEHASKTRRAGAWSAIWLALGLLPTVIFGLLQGGQSASAYAAVYLIERALSLDNVFVFAVLIAAFDVAAAQRDRLVGWGALSAFGLRIPAILIGVAVFDASHVVAYALGALLLVLAWQTARSGNGETHAPNSFVRTLQARLPLAGHDGSRLLVVRDGRRMVTPMLLCLVAIVFADVTFAVDSIPAALAISHDTTLLLASNLLALLGLRSLFQLVSVARERLRFMDETIAVLLAIVGLKLLLGGVIHIGALASLATVLVVLAVGVSVSLAAGDAAPTSSPCDGRSEAGTGT